MWIRGLLDDPDLDAAEDLLEGAVPTREFIWSVGPAAQKARPRAGREKRGAWKWVCDIAFCAALAAIVIGAVCFGGGSGARMLVVGASYLAALVSVTLRVLLGGRKPPAR
jgi:hypothetical protein